MKYSDLLALASLIKKETGYTIVLSKPTEPTRTNDGSHKRLIETRLEGSLDAHLGTALQAEAYMLGVLDTLRQVGAKEKAA
jgi:hypothetical protein